MARTHEAYPPEFRQQPVELVKSGRTPSELAREYEPAADSIRNWVVQSERDAGKRSAGLSTGALLELPRLRRENKQLRTARDILKRAAEAPTAGRGAPQRPGLAYTSIAFGARCKEAAMREPYARQTAIGRHPGQPPMATLE